MSPSHRSRDKNGPQAVPKQHSRFCKFFKKLTRAKSKPLTPEPIAASVLHQSNASERSPCNSITPNSPSASLEGSTAASGSITATTPYRQVRVADGESFPSGPDARSGGSAEPVVPTEELSNLHLGGTNASSLNQDTRERSIETAQSNDTPCQEDITSRPKTLWDRAYDALRSSNDSDKSNLIADYEEQVLQKLTAKMSGRTDQTPTNKAVLERAIEDALKQAELEGKSLARSSIDKAGKLMLALQNFIGEAVKASPEASLAWAGVCLVLPLLTKPAIADEAQRNGFSYVTSRIGFWTDLERQLANTGNWTKSVQEKFVTLYQHLLEFQVRTVLRYHQSGFECFLQDLSSNVWEQLITAIKDQEHLLHQDLQQYHHAYQSLTFEVLKQNSNKSLESNAKFLEALQEVQDLVRKDAEKKFKEEEKKCLRLFRLTDNQRDVTYEWYKSRVKTRVEGTCIWAVEHENFRKWLELKSGPLLITADPGCGKSVLAKYLIDQYLPQRCPTATICYFFFKDGDQNTVKQALCALLHQLFCQKPELIKHALEEYDRNGAGMIGTTSSLWQIFNDATRDKRAGTIIIVLDALDECKRNEFTLLVENLNKAGKSVANFLLTSRPYGDVVSPFKYGDMLNHFRRVLIPGEVEDQSDQISMEINRVIQVRVDQFVHEYELKDQVRDTLCAELNKTKHRTYLWVYLVFDHLETLVSSEALKRTAQGFRNAIEKLPRTVEDAYERILNRPQGALRTTLRRVLRVILAAQRPLTLSEMQIVVNMEPDIKSAKELDLEDEEDFSKRLRTICGLFVSIHQRKVYFLHQTAREFLQAETELSAAPGSWRSSIRKEQAHGELARICVRYIYILDPEVVHHDSDYSRLEREYPFLLYSRDYWGTHLRNSNLDDDIGLLTTAMVLCEPGSKHFRTWTDTSYNEPGEFARHFSTSLHVAVALGCNGLVRHILRNIGAKEINTGHNNRETTPLALAVRYGNRDVIRLLIEAGAKVDVGWEKQTPLYEAVKAGNSECATILLNYGASVDQSDAQGRTLLHLAARNHDAEVMEVLVKTGINVNSIDDDGNTALLACASQHKYNRSNDGIELVTVLIERGAFLDIANKDGTTALMQAVNRMRWALAKLLIEKGADPNLQNCEGQSALHMVRYSDKDEDTAISLARTLVEKCVDLDVQDGNGWTPLHVAVAGQRVELVRFLIERGACLDIANKDGTTALMQAVNRMRWALAKLLIEKGADPNLQNCEGQSALHMVRYSDKDEDTAISLARTLVEKCVDLDVQDDNGWTPLHVAVAGQRVKLVRLLLERGANIEATNHKGFTPLFLAVFMRNTKVLPLLLDSGANVNVTNNEGESLLFFAVGTSQPQIVEMLLNFGAKVECTGKGPPPLKKAVEVIHDNLNTANGILREYEVFKE